MSATEFGLRRWTVCETCGKPVCGHRSDGGFVCSRAVGHTGRHVDRGIGPDVTWEDWQGGGDAA